MINNGTLVKLMRCKIILEEVNKVTYPSLSDFQNRISHQLENIQLMTDDIKTEVSERTVKRDLKEIRQVFNIDIEYSKTRKGYYVADLQKDNKRVLDMLDSIHLFFLQKNIPDANQYIRFSTRKAVGTESFFTVLKAIRDKKKLEFTYSQYEKKETLKRLVSPLGLKEFKGFWYLIASDKQGIKTFGLDRISGLETSLEKTLIPEGFNLDDYYKHCYGIVRLRDSEPQKIIIKTTHIKACYYKANPLHHSQQIVEETDTHTTFSLFMYLTYDLQQELRSHGADQVEVLKPEGALEKERYA